MMKEKLIGKLKGKWKSVTALVSVSTLLFTVGMFNASAESNFIKSPYLLFEGSNTSMSLLWQTSDDQANVIKWGTDTSYTMGQETVGTYGTDHQHKFTINGLKPATKYYYDVDGQTGSFVTAPADDATSVKFLSYGDSRTQPSYQEQVAGLALKAYAADPAYQTILLNSGDIASSDTESNWTAQYFVPGSTYPQLHTLQSEVPMVGARGNHEGAGSVYGKYFPYPYVSNFYWSFDYGPVHITVLDEYSDYKPGSAQYNWLVNDLASTTKPWKIVMAHNPAWGAGTHGNDTNVQNVIHPLLKQYGVQLYLNGHNHNYARAEYEGIEYLTSGGGGAPSYAVDPTWPNIVKAESAYFLSEFDVNGKTMKVTSRRIDGSVIETVTLNNNKVPAADAGLDQTVTDDCNGNSCNNVNAPKRTGPKDPGYEMITLDGTKSLDQDGTISSYVWKEGETTIATDATPSVKLAVGTHTITLTVTDDDGATATDTVVVTVNPSLKDNNK